MQRTLTLKVLENSDRVHCATDGITALVLTSRVELASSVVELHVEERLVQEDGDHPVLDDHQIKQRGRVHSELIPGWF